MALAATSGNSVKVDDLPRGGGGADQSQRAQSLVAVPLARAHTLASDLPILKNSRVSCSFFSVR